MAEVAEAMRTAGPGRGVRAVMWLDGRRLRDLAVPVVVGLFQIVGTLGAWKGGHGPYGPDGDDRWGRPDGPGGFGEPGGFDGPGYGGPVHEPDALAFALLLVGPLALFGRHRWPVPVLAVAGGAVLTYSLLAYPRGPIFLSLAVAYFTAVVRGHRLAAAVGGVLGISTYAALAALPGGVPGPTLATVTFQVAWGIALLSIAELVRVGRERRAEAIRVRREEERRRAGEERLRIARELHDVLAHNISMINVQAGVALHLMDDNPEQARTALAAIKDASKDALTEVRSVLGVLRRVDEAAPRAPAAGLARLGDLVARAEAAGLTVRRRETGTARTLPSGVDLAAFRIIQEALTNVARHARASTATIRIEYGDDHVTVGVDDDGVGPRQDADSPGAGSGITGMRERTAALGGELSAGPRPGRGFRVRARLPLPPGDGGGAGADGGADGGTDGGDGGRGRERPTPEADEG